MPNDHGQWIPGLKNVEPIEPLEIPPVQNHDAEVEHSITLGRPALMRACELDTLQVDITDPHGIVVDYHYAVLTMADLLDRTECFLQHCSCEANLAGRYQAIRSALIKYLPRDQDTFSADPRHIDLETIRYLFQMIMLAIRTTRECQIQSIICDDVRHTLANEQHQSNSALGQLIRGLEAALKDIPDFRENEMK